MPTLATTVPAFHRFLDLPAELQVFTWDHAAGHLRLEIYYLRTVHGCAFTQSPGRLRVGWRVTIRYLPPASIHSLRHILMGTSRSARLIVLEKWRREIGLMAARPTDWGDSIGQKERALEELNALIEDLRRRIGL